MLTLVEHLLCTRRHFMCLRSFDPHSSSAKSHCYHPHCADEETELNDGNTQSQRPQWGSQVCSQAVPEQRPLPPSLSVGPLWSDGCQPTSGTCWLRTAPYAIPLGVQRKHIFSGDSGNPKPSPFSPTKSSLSFKLRQGPSS